MSRCFVVFLFFCVALISCSKGDENTTTPEPLPQLSNFYPLKVGNNWTYNYFRNTEEVRGLENTGIVVQVIVTGEMPLGNETYFELQTTTAGNNNSCNFCEPDGVVISRVRDSLGYLVDSGGAILFSSSNTKDYLVSKNEWGNVYRVLKADPVRADVPAGSFNCLDNERYTLNPNGVPFEGKDNLYFSEGVGEIKKTIVGPISGKILFEKHLVSYHLN
ncbi:MAG: hypothetical protein AAFP76_01590 [Bacteroidota bacterium]